MAGTGVGLLGGTVSIWLVMFSHFGSESSSAGTSLMTGLDDGGASPFTLCSQKAEGGVGAGALESNAASQLGS